MKTLQIGFMIPAHYPASTSPWDVYRDFLKNPSAETWGVTLLTPDTVYEAVIAKARSAALEEAARVAEQMVSEQVQISCPDGMVGCIVLHYRTDKRRLTPDEIAAAIRSLKVK